MTLPRPRPARRVTVDGTAWGGIAEAIALPAGLITAAFLTRQFGPEGYGAYALAASLVVWVESNVDAFLSRATVRFVSTETEDRARVATTAFRLFLATGCAVGLAVFALAPLIADAMGLPELTGYLRLLALSPPLSAAATAHEFILVGRRQYRPRALLRAIQWVGKLGFVLGLVWGGLGVEGALLAILGASALAVAVARIWVRPSLLGPSFPVRPILHYAVPLLVSGVALRLLKRVDLFALKGFGASVAEVGYYTAAQNLSLVPGMVALAFTPLVLASLGQAVGAGSPDAAREMASDALRAPFLMLPFAALGAGAAPAVIGFVYGDAFAPAASLLGLLLLAGMALVTISLGANVLTAIGRPRLTTALTAPLVVVLLGALAWTVPAFGAVGAAAAAAGVAVAGAAAMLGTVYAVWGVGPSMGTVARSAVASAVAYEAGTLVTMGGPLMLLVLLGLTLAVALLLRLIGAVDARDVATLRSLLPSGAPSS